MDAVFEGSADVQVLPANLPLPGVGVLPVNAYLLLSEEPVLIDSGIGVDTADFVDALTSFVDPKKLKWVWLTHDDADHTGSIQRIMELAPNAKLVTHAFSALRMATWWPVPLDRVHAVRPGDEIHVGDRTLRAVAPPLFDSPLSIGAVDTSTGSLFSVDSFGAILPEATQDPDAIPREVLAGGMLGWATSDSPWLHVADTQQFGRVLQKVRELQPSRIFSAHLPPVSGAGLEDFIKVFESVPNAEPFMPPNAEQFTEMIQAMTAAQQGEEIGGAT